MKQLYFISVLLACSAVATAQVNKGTIVLGGNIAYQDILNSETGPNGSYSTRSVSVNPSIGKAIGNNVVLGIDLGYTHGTNSNVGGSQADYHSGNNSFSAGVFIRRYKQLGNGFYLFGQAQIGAGWSNGSSVTPGYSETSLQSDGYSVYFQLYPGIAYALNRHWQIETGLPNFFAVNYAHGSQTVTYTGQPAQTVSGHSLNITSSLTGSNELTVGVRYFIGG